MRIALHKWQCASTGVMRGVRVFGFYDTMVTVIPRRGNHHLEFMGWSKRRVSANLALSVFSPHFCVGGKEYDIDTNLHGSRAYVVVSTRRFSR